MHYWCLATSVLLLGYLLYLTIKNYKKTEIKEIIFHLFWILLIIAGNIADIFVNVQSQWVDYLTISMATVTVFSYIWFHQRFVREYQANFIAEQRMKIVLSQIQPHFIYNALSSIQNIEGNPEETKKAITEFVLYSRQPRRIGRKRVDIFPCGTRSRQGLRILATT